MQNTATLRTTTPPRGINCPHSHRWFCAIIALNFLDLLFTTYFIESGHATEANVIMATAYLVSPAYFALVKMSLAVFALSLLYLNRFLFSARLAIRLVTIAYGLVVSYHLIHFPFDQVRGLLATLFHLGQFLNILA